MSIFREKEGFLATFKERTSWRKFKRVMKGSREVMMVVEWL